MILPRDNSREYCYVRVDGSFECYNYGFWYSNTGTIVKYSILASIFVFFMAWFIGGYLHAKSRMKKGKKLLGYHRWLVSYSDKRKYGQLPNQQNHFTFYAQPQTQPQPRPYTQRTDGAWTEAPPMYMGNDAPPSYYAPPGGPGANPTSPKPWVPMGNVGAQQQPQPAGGHPMAPQETGVVGAGGSQGVEGQQQHQQQQQQGQGSNGFAPLPARPEQAKVAISKLMSRFRK